MVGVVYTISDSGFSHYPRLMKTPPQRPDKDPPQRPDGFKSYTSSDKI